MYVTPPLAFFALLRPLFRVAAQNLRCHVITFANLPSHRRPSTTQFVPPPPSDLNWLTDGNYQIQAALYDASGNRVFCYQFAVSLSD